MLSLGLRARYFNPRRFQGTVRGKILKHYTVLRSVPAATVLRVSSSRSECDLKALSFFWGESGAFVQKFGGL